MMDLMSPNMAKTKHTHTHLRQPENILIVYTHLSRQFVTHTLSHYNPASFFLPHNPTFPHAI